MNKPLITLEWISRLQKFNKLFVGFSGGLDSTVLLHILASYPSLRTKIHAVHINHGLSSNALYWQKHCEVFCLGLGLVFTAEPVWFDACANIEERARKARYQIFTSLLTEEDCILVGHHLDDQAETLLLQLLRGAGVHGLAAMTELGSLGRGTIARPFLSCSRKELESYALSNQLTWIEDESNQDIHYSRNYLRQKIMPLLVVRWPGAVGNLARTATHCQHALRNLEALAIQDSPELLAPKKSLRIEVIRALNFERSVNVLRFWLKKNQIPLPSTVSLQRIIHELILARPDAMPLVDLDTIQIRRYQDRLYLVKKDAVASSIGTTLWAEFPLPLILADKRVLTAKTNNFGLVIPRDANLTIQFRKGGELFFWHGQTKQLKKLFQEWNIPPWIRDRIPLVYIGDQLAAIVGYAVSDLFYSSDSTEAWQLFLS